jgi:hypothetical protein
LASLASLWFLWFNNKSSPQPFLISRFAGSELEAGLARG